ncbi:transcription factor [Ophiostoma piceae UAMH 11346]|uniref:Transcription factor n=1 Tax=Ophiostoma piceae (strain UAMH 11346) TaxID=1262450 RepID=S3C7W9_OPHP1|nr:transcription factor [Ophiostoma piceae UAMH 11346]
MPPRSSLTSSFSISSDSTNEVEKRYRSMQEHIRRAHPEYYIPKLPATEDSFTLMITSTPSERPPTSSSDNIPGGLSGSPPLSAMGGPPMHSSPIGAGPSPASSLQSKAYLHESSPHNPTSMPRSSDEFLAGPATAAVALTQLHDYEGGWPSDDKSRITHTSIELPPIHNISHHDIHTEPFPGMNHNRPRELLPSILSTSPPGRSSTLPPLQRMGPGRARKQSITKRGRESHHKKQKSRGSNADWLRRVQNDPALDRLRPGGQIKAMSAEPGSTDFGKRWEDLIDAAASATEDIDEDRTPVPQSPISIHRASLPPFPHQAFQHHQQHGYQASPLQQALTPPSYAQEAPEPFPSVESNESGDVFNMDPRGLNDSSPTYPQQPVQIYCAVCHGLSPLKESYACTECICGLCQPCVDIMVREQGGRRECPRCHTVGGRFKPFQLDLR